jgi:hypothetical protein
LKHRHCRGRSDRLKSNFLFPPLFHVPLFSNFRSTVELSSIQYFSLNKIQKYSITALPISGIFFKSTATEGSGVVNFQLKTFPFDWNWKMVDVFVRFVAIFLDFENLLPAKHTENGSNFDAVRFRRIASHAVSISSGPLPHPQFSEFFSASSRCDKQTFWSEISDCFG